MQNADRAARKGRGFEGTLAGCTAALAVLLLASAAAAQPLDLSEQRARPIQVAIEISPPDLPARLDHHYSERGVAWFEPGPGPGRATVRIEGREVERLLRSFDAVPGSFSDYVWVFETSTGHVLSASVQGAFYRPVKLGPMHTRVRANVSADMSTLRTSGFRPPRARLGNVLFEHCLARDAGCNTVAPRPLDPSTGYVNAVGRIVATVAGGIHSETYSPLGEAVFTEMRSDTAVSAR